MQIDVVDFIDNTRLVAPKIVEGGWTVRSVHVLTDFYREKLLPVCSFKTCVLYSMARSIETFHLDGKVFLIWDEGFLHLLAKLIGFCKQSAGLPIFQQAEQIGDLVQDLYFLLLAETSYRFDNMDLLKGAMFHVYGRNLMLDPINGADKELLKGSPEDRIFQAAQLLCLFHELGHIQHYDQSWLRDAKPHLESRIKDAIEMLEAEYSKKNILFYLHDRMRIEHLCPSETGHLQDFGILQAELSLELFKELKINAELAEEIFCDAFSLISMMSIEEQLEGSRTDHSFITVDETLIASSVVYIALSMQEVIKHAVSASKFGLPSQRLLKKINMQMVRRRLVEKAALLYYWSNRGIDTKELDSASQRALNYTQPLIDMVALMEKELLCNRLSQISNLASTVMQSAAPLDEQRSLFLSTLGYERARNVPIS